jgi:hypothetical protein
MSPAVVHGRSAQVVVDLRDLCLHVCRDRRQRRSVGVAVRLGGVARPEMTTDTPGRSMIQLRAGWAAALPVGTSSLSRATACSPRSNGWLEA